MEGKEMHRAKYGSFVPQGAVLLSNDHIVEMRLNKIKQIQPQTKVWPLSYGSEVLAICGMISTGLIVSLYRHKFQLGTHKMMLTYLPMVSGAGLCSGLFHNLFVSRNIVLGLWSCPNCLEIRSGIVQAMSNVLYGPIVAPVICSVVAKEMGNFHSPKEARAGLLHIYGLTANKRMALLGFFLANVAAGMFVGSQEIKTYIDYLMPRERQEGEWS